VDGGSVAGAHLRHPASASMGAARLALVKRWSKQLSSHNAAKLCCAAKQPQLRHPPAWTGGGSCRCPGPCTDLTQRCTAQSAGGQAPGHLRCTQEIARRALVACCAPRKSRAAPWSLAVHPGNGAPRPGHLLCTQEIARRALVTCCAPRTSRAAPWSLAVHPQKRCMRLAAGDRDRGGGNEGGGGDQRRGQGQRSGEVQQCKAAYMHG